MKVVTHGEAQTMEFAKSLTPHFSAATVVFLNGHPGAGKTHFVKGVLAALGYGGLYVYENYLAESVNHTIANTADFATDAKVKNFDANKMQ